MSRFASGDDRTYLVTGAIRMREHTIDYGSFGRPAAGERVSGDAAVIEATDAVLFLAVVDVLGHGPEAHAVALRAEACLRTSWSQDVVATMLRLHEELKGTRGAVAGICALELGTASVRYCGVGNTAIGTLESRPTGLYSTEGILGSRIRTPREGQLQLEAGEILVLHTDGISEDFRSQQRVQSAPGSAGELSRRIVDEHRRPYDDATCIVAINVPTR